MAGGLTYTVDQTTKLSTAEIYATVLADLAEDHPEIVTLTPDLAKSTKVGVFAERFPDRFYNFGIAEANMIGAAAGMAACGLVPFTSSFAIFNSMRALDQVHTDVCYPNLGVKMIGSHAGLSFGQAGSTHHCTEDLAIMRSMANLTVLCPADGVETANAVIAAYERPGPVYVRINRGFDQVVYERMDYGFEVGRAVCLHEGTDLTVIACGAGVFQAVQAARELADIDGVSVRVLDMHTIKPLDVEAVRAAVQETRRIVTVEDHTVVGGLGGAVAEVVAEGGRACVFRRLGLQDCFSPIGLHEDLMSHHGFDMAGIVAAVREVMELDFEDADDWDDEF
ncbi:transketolase [Austwickia chelonae]|uniref:Transketolase n=1 Tax=Austwickia chelonae NBRC 105200 TaxID=1184607 RepID=K6ULE4_9MICO|nr:transketolase C-terminal domain-containing protein [Austwickia chelonae]GAB77176.1 transketolase [Austwickia chelonae NBRC 105200]SEW04520.1 transketolase [Austwickia chelonae]